MWLWRFGQGCGGGGGGGGGGRDVVVVVGMWWSMMMMITDDDDDGVGAGVSEVEVVAEQGCRRWRWWRSRGVGGGGGGGVEVVAEQWCRRWRWWRSRGVGGGGGGGVEVVAEQWCRRWRWCQEEVNVCEEKTWVHVCSKKRSRRPFLMKGLRENKQAADIKRLRASASRRHKWPEVLLAKKQTAPKFLSDTP
ncbi:hypothetical protein HanRHA438_Chr15g0719001 [Helianthus annuus]|nr:hypothetical protein HanRHA438_Chr15g0719001 [Helianthus annuus]